MHIYCIPVFIRRHFHFCHSFSFFKEDSLSFVLVFANDENFLNFGYNFYHLTTVIWILDVRQLESMYCKTKTTALTLVKLMKLLKLSSQCSSRR